jgi:hypothetical protein
LHFGKSIGIAKSLEAGGKESPRFFHGNEAPSMENLRKRKGALKLPGQPLNRFDVESIRRG